MSSTNSLFCLWISFCVWSFNPSRSLLQKRIGIIPNMHAARNVKNLNAMFEIVSKLHRRCQNMNTNLCTLLWHKSETTVQIHVEIINQTIRIPILGSVILIFTEQWIPENEVQWSPVIELTHWFIQMIGKVLKWHTVHSKMWQACFWYAHTQSIEFGHALPM